MNTTNPNPKSWLLAVAVLFSSVQVEANGFAMGHRYVPAVQNTEGKLAGSSLVSIKAGEPIYLDDDFKPYYHEKPIRLKEGALPDRLAGYRLYRDGKFTEAATKLWNEASDETNPISRSWLYILSGHSYLIAKSPLDPQVTEAYRRAYATPTNPFSPYGLYFISKLKVLQEDYEGALRDVRKLVEEFGEGCIQPRKVVLFTTYMHGPPGQSYGSPTIAGYFTGYESLEKSIKVLVNLIHTRQEYAVLVQEDGADKQARIALAYAKAVEELWAYFPPRFILGPSEPSMPVEARHVLRRISAEWPNTEAGAEAYFKLLSEYELPYEFNGDKVARHRFWYRQMEKFLDRYPDSNLSPEAKKRLKDAEESLRALGVSP